MPPDGPARHASPAPARAGPRRVSNPPNPWASTHVEWIGEPPPVRLEVFEERARTVLTQNESPDVPFRYSVNPYRGCQHACAYCYARPGHQYLGFGAGTDFDSKIVVKTNAAERLREELARGRLGSEWIAFSGVTDCYQPLEAAYGLTRACLEACREFRVQVGIVTKSALVRRDAELLASFRRFCEPQVYLSIPFADDATARRIEPSVTAISKRFETLRALSEAGVTTGVALAPLIPGLNDSHVVEILQRAREAGATRAFSILLRLTQEVRPIFEQRLRVAFPERAGKVLNALDETRAAQRARGERSSDFESRMRGAGPRYEAARDLFELTRRRLGFECAPDGPPEAAELGALRPGRPPSARPLRARQGELFD